MFSCFLLYLALVIVLPCEGIALFSGLAEKLQVNPMVAVGRAEGWLAG